MKWLKLGSTAVNMERAIRIDDHGWYLEIALVADDQATVPLNVRVEGEEAEGLRRWVNANAAELPPDLMSLKSSDVSQRGGEQ